MPWLNIEPDPHPPECECRLPNLDGIEQVDAHPGSRWQCPFCDKIWMLLVGPSWAPDLPEDEA